MKRALLTAVLLVCPGIAGNHAAAEEPDAELQSISVPGTSTSTGKRSNECGQTRTGSLGVSAVSVRRLIGMRVTNPINEDIGDVSDLIVDECGRITNLIVHVGGFMGVGGEYVPVSLDKVRIHLREHSGEMIVMVRATLEHMLRSTKSLSQSEP